MASSLQINTVFVENDFTLLANKMLDVTYVIINLFNGYCCPNPNYPYQFYNSSSSKYECYDTCPDKHYVDYSSSLKSLTCLPCSIANCL